MKQIEENAELDTKVVIYSEATEYFIEVRGLESVVNFYDKSHTCEEIGMEIQKMARKISDDKLEKKIKDTLLKVGFKVEHKGTAYIRECVKMAIKEEKKTLELMYEDIAERRGKQATTVKADVQGAINKMWHHSNKEKVRKFFRLGDYESPSPSSVVSMMKYYIDN